MSHTARTGGGLCGLAGVGQQRQRKDKVDMVPHWMVQINITIMMTKTMIDHTVCGSELEEAL